MKKNVFSYVILIVLIGIMSACTNKKTAAQLLPDDSSFVISMDVESLIKASDITNDEGLKDKIKHLIKSADIRRKTQRKMQALIEDPLSAGIDLRKPFYCSLLDVKQNQLAFTGSISDKKDFENFLSMLSDEEESIDEPQPINDESDLMYILFDYNSLLMYNDQFFIITNNARGDSEDDFIEDTAELFNLKNNFSDTKVYADFVKEEGQLKCCFITEQVTDTRDFERALRTVPFNIKNYIEKFRDSYFIMTLNLKKGEMDYTTQFYPNSKEATRLTKEFYSFSSEIEGEHLKFVDENSLFTMMLNCNGKKYVAFLSSMLGDIAKNQEIEKFLAAFESIDGDITFNMDGDFINEELPNMNVLCNISKKEPINNIINLFGNAIEQTSDDSWNYSIKKNQIVETGQQTYNRYLDRWEPDYEWREVEIAQVNFGYEDDNAYIILDKNAKEPVEVNNPMGKKDIKGVNFYARLNFKKILEIEELKPIFENDKDGEIAKGIIQNLDYLEITANNDLRSEMRCVMSNKDINPLHALIELIKDEL